MTSQPADNTPAVTAFLSISPLVRVSLAMTIFPQFTKVLYALPNSEAILFVNELPTTPLTPDIPIFSDLIHSLSHQDFNLMDLAVSMRPDKIAL